MESFGKYGYKKTSVNDIAKKAGISKSMVFYYFESKLGLYFYLIQLSYDEVMNVIKEDEVFKIKNFFDRLNFISQKKIIALENLPGVMKFLTSFYFEEDEAIFDYKMKILAESEDTKKYFMLTELDRKMFKDTVDPEIVLKMINKWSAGLVQELQFQDEFDIDAILEEVRECMDMMKLNFCKEGYLL